MRDQSAFLRGFDEWLDHLAENTSGYRFEDRLQQALVGIGGRVVSPEHSLAVTFPEGWAWARYAGDDPSLVVDRFAGLADRRLATEAQALLAELSPIVHIVATPGSGVDCLITTYPSDLGLGAMAANDVRNLEASNPWGTTATEVAVTELSLPAGEAYRVDWDLEAPDGGRLVTSDYTIKREPLPEAYSQRLTAAAAEFLEESPTSLQRDGAAVVVACRTAGDRPPDHWLSIAETIEFLPFEN